MTFEEFFTKKRIDLAQLQRANPALYEEFRNHYAQMSERSFDHTKKYWFNRLRKDFLLEVVETPKGSADGEATANVADAPPANEIATKPAGSSSTSPSGFKPRFKSGVTTPPVKKAAESPVSGEDSQQPHTRPASAEKPLGFKPRFKASVTPPTKPESGDDVPNPETTEPKPKPLGFKPRFKSGNTNNKNT